MREVISEVTLLKILGQNLKKARDYHQYSIKEVAGLVSYDRHCLSSLERGEKSVKINTVIKLAKALDVSLPGLFSRNFHIQKQKEYSCFSGAFMPDQYMIVYVENLKNILNKTNHFQYSIYSTSGIDASIISKIITGKYENPTVSTLTKIANSIHMELSYMFIRS